MRSFLTEQIKITKLSDAATAATTDVNGASVDMQADGGWEGVVFFTSYGTAAANNLMHVEQSTDNSSFADLEGSEVDGGASDEDQYVEVFQPRERYVRPVALRGTSSTLENIWAIQYRSRRVPVSSIASGTMQGKALNRPAEGTK